MNWLRNKKLLIYFALIYILGFYAWIYMWEKDDQIQSVGSSIFSLTAPAIAALLLFHVYKKWKNNDRLFWLFLSLGCWSQLLAEVLAGYRVQFSHQELSSPGWIDFLLMLQLLFYFAAFLHKILQNYRSLQLIKYIFDICIIFTVALTFSWHFILQDIFAKTNTSLVEKVVAAVYPIGDLILIFGVVALYFGYEHFFQRYVLYFLTGSLFLHVISDSLYLYSTGGNAFYSVGSLYDPLFGLSQLGIGISGIYALERGVKPVMNAITNKSFSIKNYISLRLLLPYMSVLLLLIVRIFTDKEFPSLIFGSAIAVTLVIIRQITNTLENHTLLAKYLDLTEDLEQKVSERTEELSSKNHQLLTAVKKMKHMAFHDVLSGLPNRRMFLERLIQALEAAKRNHYKIAVLFIDLDRFKNINDTLGHEFGDLLLKHVSKKMENSIRKIDTISRQGGDEFTMILNRIRAEEDVIPLIKRIQAIVAQPITIKGKDLHVSMSIGVAFYPGDGKDAEQLMKNADMAMYRAKEEGRDNFKFFSIDMNKNMSRKVAVENGLRAAIRNKEFVLYFQPQVNITTGEIVGIESLIRWNTMEAGMIPPNEFIPVAEETGLIIPIGEWVLYQACLHGKEWHDAGHSNLKIAVNLSPVQFLYDGLIEMVTAILKKTGFNPNFLELEITEGITLTDAEAAIQKMHALQKLGVLISIDDFGTGYSSLLYVKRFPIRTLKIAQQFIKEVTSNPRDKVLVETIISMAHSLGLSVITEGVETKEQLLLLKELQCDVVQGDFYSKPLTSMQFSALIESNAKRTGNILIHLNV